MRRPRACLVPVLGPGFAAGGGGAGPFRPVVRALDRAGTLVRELSDGWAFTSAKVARRASRLTVSGRARDAQFATRDG
jgi:hypothetical protein